ncbi:endonuclease/exonuclease/phosphatase family protein [Thalassotalea profundi]|nr:endonuclease/exonuclease/phosphatase family protein [Thalassotalea profundi]
MEKDTIRVATFNVSMDASNYVNSHKNKKLSSDALNQALDAHHSQIKNIAEIIQQINPDIILLNEFDYQGQQDKALIKFMTLYLEKSQNNQSPIKFPYYYQADVNTGVKTKFDLNNDAKITTPADTYGFGSFPGQYGMAILSKYPIDKTAIRTFQYFKWKDMPGALKPVDPKTNNSWYSEQAWADFRLSSKSHWDIPISINNKKIHVLASHPTPPVFDGPEDRNGKRNHDEIRFWVDYVDPLKSSYIYDDNNKYGGLSKDSRFVILGDLNASNLDGDAIYNGINSLLTSPFIQDPKPESLGGASHNSNNSNAKYHTAFWGMRADYVLPSVSGWVIKKSGIFWPNKEDTAYQLIKDRNASSDHRLVWVDLTLTK